MNQDGSSSTLLGLCAVGFFARASYAMARTPVLALFAVALGAGPEAIGLAVAISTVTGVFFKMPAGVVSDVIGRKRTLMAGLVVFALVPIAYLWVTSFPALVVVRFLHGFATAIYGPVAMAVVAEVAQGRRGEMLSWFSSVTIIGNLIGAPLGGLLLNSLGDGEANSIADFHVVYAVVAAMGGTSFLLALWVLRGQPGAPAPAQGRNLTAVLGQLRRGVREILLNRQVLITSNMEGVQNLSVGALEAFLPVYVVLVAGLSPLHAGSLWGVQIVVTIAAKPLAGGISDRYGRRPLIFWGMFLCAVPFALIPWVINFPALLLLAALFGLGEALVTSSAAAMVADLCDERQLGSAMGAFGTIYDVGHAAGPLLAGALIGLSAEGDWRLAFALIAAILIASALVFRFGLGKAELDLPSKLNP